MEKLEELFHKHPYLSVVGGGLILLLLYYLFFSGSSSSSSSNNSAAAYYSAAAAASGANAAAQASEYQSQAQLQAYQLQAGAAGAQISAQQETTDTANNDAVTVAQIQAQEAVDLTTQQDNAQLIALQQTAPYQEQNALLAQWLGNPSQSWGGQFASIFAAAGQTKPSTALNLLTAPTITIPAAGGNTTSTPATTTQTGQLSAA